MFANRLPWKCACAAVGVMCLPLMPGSAAWEDWQQTHKLTADDAAEDDWFGWSVAVSGDVAIIGALRNDSAGQDAGSAYLCDVTSGYLYDQLFAYDHSPDDFFGFSVSINGDLALVGAVGDDDDTGSAYVFDVTTGWQLHKLIADDPAEGDWFGYSVALDGDFALVGAPGDDTFTGSAYVFDVTTGQQLHKLMADDGAEFDMFGYSVVIDGDLALVGADGDDDYAGSAYVFDVTTGQQLHKLTADDPAEGDDFGYSVAIDGDLALIGAPGDDDNAGSAYVFDVTTGQQLHKLTADDPAEWDGFGWSVSISGDIAIIGARNDQARRSGSGSAYVFHLATGQQLDKLLADDAAEGDRFGFSVSISGNVALVGAPGDDDACPEDPECDSGSAYLFEAVQCPADFDGDGDVDTADLLFLLGAWGTPNGDVDGDGDTDTADLLALLAAWGECP